MDFLLNMHRSPTRRQVSCLNELLRHQSLPCLLRHQSFPWLFIWTTAVAPMLQWFAWLLGSRLLQASWTTTATLSWFHGVTMFSPCNCMHAECFPILTQFLGRPIITMLSWSYFHFCFRGIPVFSICTYCTPADQVPILICHRIAAQSHSARRRSSEENLCQALQGVVPEAEHNTSVLSGEETLWARSQNEKSWIGSERSKGRGRGFRGECFPSKFYR